MTNLECNVSSCCHNDKNVSKCSLSSIHVQGTNASTASDTCCGSYFEDTTDAVRNSFSNSSVSPKASLNVSCDAKDCIYNEASACNAPHIDISGVCATDAKETVCTTFESRQNCFYI